jgi:hypothetical protein
MTNWYDVVERTRRHEEQYNEQEPCDDLLVMLLDGRGHPCPEQRANSAPGETPTALNVDALQRHAYVSA